jgi:DNA-binding NarL/FixJ family response regulator
MNAPDGRITIMLVDDHALFREGVNEILRLEDDLAVVAEAADSREAIELAARQRPNVVLLDVEIPGPGVMTTIDAIHRVSPDSRVIILTMYDAPPLLRDLLAAGIYGYLLKSVHRQNLIAAVRSACHDDDRIVVEVSRQSLNQIQGLTGELLSDREREILVLTAQARTNAQIGIMLGITEATVKRHLRNIFAKLGAVSRIDAVNKAVAASLIGMPERHPPPGGGPGGLRPGPPI